MPYDQFTKTVGGKKKYCLKNKNTGQVTCYSSEAKRKTGIRMKEAFAHGFKPRKKR
jgi:hypothetical protein